MLFISNAFLILASRGIGLVKEETERAPTRIGALFRRIRLKAELQPHAHGARHGLCLVEIQKASLS